jgi:hypothetical protein
MEIRIRATGAVMFESEFRSVAGASWDQTTVEILDQLGADPVLEGPQPSTGRYQVVYRDGVEQIDGQWFTKYSLGPIFTDNEEATAAQQEADYKVRKDAEQAKGVREDRNKRLADCDWTQLADAPGDKTAWASYRLSLRDVSSQDGFPWDVTWPDKP